MQRFDRATALMLDFVDFTEMAVAREPDALVAELSDIFAAFDRIAELFGCERIKTIRRCLSRRLWPAGANPRRCP